MIIRPETPSDYSDIANINVRAFDERADEALIVSLSRHRSTFDPDLSLIAEDGGQIVGHALFSPLTIRLLGESVRVVNLGPIAVDPNVQKKGIGAALIAEGHAVARAKGYSLSFLLGHPTYYPRFGYQRHAFGASRLTLHEHNLPTNDLDTRKPVEADLPVLHDLWLREEGGVDFSIDPGDQLIDWISPNPAITAQVYLRHEAIVGYTRIHRDEPYSPGVFFAADGEAARMMAWQIGGGKPVDLPLHPYSASAAALGMPEANAWEAAMVCSLIPGAFEDYFAQVEAGTRIPGRPIWPVAFEVA